MKVSIRYGRTFNLGNYQTERIDLELERDLTLAELIKWQEHADALFKEIQNKVMAWYDELKQREEAADQKLTRQAEQITKEVLPDE